MKRFGCGVGIICLAAVVSATDYTETLTVGAGESLTLTGENTAPSFLDNGSLTLSANSSLTVTSEDKTSDVANGVNATLTLESGATLDVTRVTKAASNEALGIGILGGTGTLNIAPGAFLEANGRRVRFSRNADDKRNLLSQAIVNLDGTIRLTTAELAAYFPVNAEFVANTNDYPVSSIINFSSTGLFIVSDIAVNDAARAIWNMTGGTVQFTSSQGGLFSGNYGIMEINFTEGSSAVFDTQNHNITTARGKRVLFQGAGGLTKKGSGTLDLGNSAAYSTFTGPIRVEAGTLILGRPLAPDQTVYVCIGAHFQKAVPEDDAQITYEAESERPANSGLYTISSYFLPGIDLLGYGSRFDTDRLGGPTGSLAAEVTGPITHADTRPFRLIGQSANASVTFTDTGLETFPIRCEGTGTFIFAGERDLDINSIGQLSFDGGTYKQADYLNIYGTEASHYLLENGTLSSAKNIYIGRDGDNGYLTARNAKLQTDDTLVLGGCVSGDNRSRTCGTLLAIDTTITPNNGIRFSPNNPTDGSTAGQLSNILTLQGSSDLRAPAINGNDDSFSQIFFDGGKITMTRTGVTFITAGQNNTMIDIIATNGHDIVFDTGNTTNVLAQSTTAGNVRFLGDGNFIKRGVGRLEVGNNTVESRFQMTYTGDTVIEGGTLRLAGNDLFPFGEGTGVMTLNAGTTLDMNGKALKVNDLTGNGTLVNTAGNIGRLDLGADNRDLNLARALPDNISLEKSGSGLMQVFTTLPPNLSIYGGTVNFPENKYRFFRFKVELVAGAEANSVQFSELQLINGSTDVTRPYLKASRSGTGKASPGAEQPEQGLDGNLETKFLDFNGARNNEGSDTLRDQCWLQIEYAEPITVSAYTWATANDADYGTAASRDPMNWRFQGSNDGVTWIDLDVQANYVSRTTRKVWIYDTFQIGAGSEDNICTSVANTAVFIGESATLEVAEGQNLKVASISNAGGTVSVGEDATLIVSPAAGATTSLSGGVSGSGSVQIDGEGSVTMVGESDYTGKTLVKAGTLRLLEIAENENKWFRLTIKKSYDGGIMQLSEFGLYALDGSRQNLNLVTLPAGTAPQNLTPGSFCKAANYSAGRDTEDADKLFDDNTGTKWCATNVSMNNPTDGNTWRIVTMRLANTAKPVCSYNFCSANDSTPARNPISWMLESSSDGITWKVVAEVNDDPNTARATYTWFNSGTPYTMENVESENAAEAVSPLSPASMVEVAANATLSVEGTNTQIGALQVDYQAGGGTITRFNPGANGVLNMVNVPEGTNLHNYIVPLTLEEVVDSGNIGSWKVQLDGVDAGAYRVIIDGSRHLVIVKSGMVMIFK